MNLSGCVGALQLLGDESRIRLCALLRERELSVTDLVRVTGISQSRVSTHLARLREGGFVRDRKDGTRCFYGLARESLPAPAKVVLDETADSADPTLEGDRRRLSELDAARRGALPESFAGEMERHYSPGRTWQSLAMGLAALLDLGDVLDAGSGDGAAASHVAPYCRSLTCVDTNPRMIEAARVRLRRYSHVRTQVADLQDLPFGASSFDAVLLFHTLTYAEKPQLALEECTRVLRDDGRLVVLALHAHDRREITTAFGERHAGFEPRALKRLLTRAGLDVRFCEITCREAKRPHFQVVLSIARKAHSGLSSARAQKRRSTS